MTFPAPSLSTRARPSLPRPVGAQSTGSDNAALHNLIYGNLTPSVRLPVNEETAYGLVGVNAAVTKIANAVGQMMSAADVYGPDGRTPLATVPNIVADPGVGLFMDPFVYWKEVVSHGLMRGNWIGVKADPDPVTLYPRQLIPLPIDAVHAAYDEDGYAFYEFEGEHYRPDEVVHVRLGLTIPGRIMAIGVVEAHRRGLSGMLDQQRMEASIWREGAVPSGIVQLDTPYPTKEETGAVKEGWVSVLENRRTVAVTGTAMTYTPLTWSADDAQFLESQQFSIAKSALMFGLRPEDLGSSFGASKSMTYGNRTDDALQRIVDSYVPVMLPIEQAWSRLVPGRAFVRGNVEALLRSTTSERYDLHEKAQAIGLETVDETRDIEGKPPLLKSEEPKPTTEQQAETTDPTTEEAAAA